MSNPAISVVMPVRNGQAFLQAAIDSVAGQTFADFEFLIVDDGSTDATPGILKAAAADDRRIRLLRSGGEGIVAALNLGLGTARGDLVARMDADDIALPERFETQMRALRDIPKLLVLGTAAIAIDAQGSTGARIEVPSGPADVQAALRTTNPILHPTVMMRREPALASGGYRRALTYAEDYDLWLRLARQGMIANLAQPLMRLRRHAGQISKVRRLDQRAAMALARQVDRDACVVDADADLHGALRAHLLDRQRSLSPIAPAQARDIAVMLRAGVRAGQLSPDEIADLCRRLGTEGRLPRAWMLPIRLWLGR